MQRHSTLHLPSLWMLIISGLGFLFYLGSAAGLAMVGIMGLAAGFADRLEVLSFFSLAWTALAVCVLLVPSGFLALRQLVDLPELRIPSPPWRVVIPGLAAIWPILLMAGYGISHHETLSIFLLPPLQVLAVLLPVLGVLLLALRGLNPVRASRAWGIITIGLLLTPLLIIFAEFMVILLSLVVAGVGISIQPGALEAIREFSRQLSQAAELDPQQLQDVLLPLASKPAVIFGTLALVAGIIPVLEEMLKPLGVWFLAGQRLTPQEGFMAGAFSGAAFAFLESLGMLANPAGEAWLGLAVGRAGTAALHIACSALVGWGLAMAWSERKYFQLALSYGLAIVLHGTWNALSLLSGFAVLVPFDPSPNLLVARSLGQIAPAGLLILVLTILVLLGGVKTRLQPSTVEPPMPPVPPVDTALQSGL